MSWVLELPGAPAEAPPPVPAVGSMVRTADRGHLETALRAPAALPRPIPAQLRHGGQLARVVSVRFDAERHPFYRLAGLPGEWQPEWLHPAIPRSAEPADGGGPAA